MANVVVVGSQWGDEGKGKIVDWLSERADIVVRFQGGHNAGHTLVIDGVSYKLSLLPSGLVRGKLSVIGNGVVIDPHALVAEIARLRAQDITIDRSVLRIADNATLILSLHRELDAVRENSNTGTKIGTTKRGIGPAYEDKVGRRAIRVMDLANLKTLPDKIDRLLSHHNPLRRGLGYEEIDPKSLFDELESVADEVLPYMDTVWKLLDDQRRAGKRILFEGAQGAFVDILTTALTHSVKHPPISTADKAATGSGLGAWRQSAIVLGITKPYTTRSARGLSDGTIETRLANILVSMAMEWGTVTGRKRRCGCLTAVAGAPQTLRTNGIDGHCLDQAFDFWTGLMEIKIWHRYRLMGTD
ncbi:UNVERIFIED_CONTAM: hypothetical protein GTU68_048529 [Idotea baltica]|nr:hypothetical protein [Idotea baltica]